MGPVLTHSRFGKNKRKSDGMPREIQGNQHGRKKSWGNLCRYYPITYTTEIVRMESHVMR